MLENCFPQTKKWLAGGAQTVSHGSTFLVLRSAELRTLVSITVGAIHDAFADTEQGCRRFNVVLVIIMKNTS
jgi:hypothetical protein